MLSEILKRPPFHMLSRTIFENLPPPKNKDNFAVKYAPFLPNHSLKKKIPLFV